MSQDRKVAAISGEAMCLFLCNYLNERSLVNPSVLFFITKAHLTLQTRLFQDYPLTIVYIEHN